MINHCINIYLNTVYRDAPEATGEEPEDTDFDMPKIYEPVCYEPNTIF